MNHRLLDMPVGDPLQNGRDVLALRAALDAAAALAPYATGAAVTYRSAGRTLVLGYGADALAWADQLATALPVTLLLLDASVLPARNYTVCQVSDIALDGWLGAFHARWQVAGEGTHAGQFDLVLDLSAQPLIARHQSPHGYAAPGSDETARRDAVTSLLGLVGDFDKPTYFAYQERLCAHSRNSLNGCNACIEVCSAQAIAGHGDRIKVNPYLCAGCGACSTVCPTGALGYAYPSAVHTGSRIKAALRAYAAAGGQDPLLLFHSEEGAALLARAGALPGRVIPFALEHTASVGIDVWLAALAYGAAGITVLMSAAEAPQYAQALAAQSEIAACVMDGLGYAGPHFQLLRVTAPEELCSALLLAPRGARPLAPASFDLAKDKRNTLDYALDHLFRHAPQHPASVPLPVGAPFGAVAVNTASCSLCMACVGACPSTALMDTPNAPQLRFVEQNCVQCGLCASSCPEHAISLLPRMLFGAARSQTVVLNESQPFHCIRCSKPFGTVHMIENMLSRLGQHSAFAGNLDRLRMCADCRVIDQMQPAGEFAVALRRPG